MDMNNFLLPPEDLDNEESNNEGMIPIIGEDLMMNNDDVPMPETLPILPLRNTVLFPGVIMPITLGRQKSLRLIRDLQDAKGYFGAVAQRDAREDNPDFRSLYDVGTMAKIIKVLEMPDGTTSVIIQGKKRFVMTYPVSSDPYLVADVMELTDIEPTEEQQREYEAVAGSIKDMALRIIKTSANYPPEAIFSIKNIESRDFLINFVCSNTDATIPEKQNLLGTNELLKRGMDLLEMLVKELQLLELKKDIQSKVKVDIDQQQREYLLQQQIKTIQNELGGNPAEQEAEELRKKAATKNWGAELNEIFEKEIGKLQRINPMTGEFSVQLTYLQTLTELPWNEYTTDNFDLKQARRILDRDHHGLDKVKERILEHLAVLKLKGDLKSPILCLTGPPGVGKTSLGRSVAEALGRQYVRMSLGGLHDEAEIRGHRRTYIGAMPGRIIQNIKKAGAANPVFILDEIDKISNSFHGDPASALLEVLDPEQNETFHDNYLDIDFDLSKVMFIATANSLSTISPPLLDRMEVIEVSSYLLEEKIEISRNHLLPKAMENHGITPGTFTISKPVLAAIIDGYTREAGVRELDKVLSRICRKIALKIATDVPIKKSVTTEAIKELLGAPRFNKDKWLSNDFAGVVTGLAWTAAGGEILFVESSISKGNGKLTLTGNLGEVMKESAMIALEYLRAHAELLNLPIEAFDNANVHIHVPEGAIPKDGPSAGITMATSIASAITKRKVREKLAMTGEITLRGKVLPVGGIREKILAAKRAGITTVLLCEENRKDVNEIKPIYIEGLEIIYFNTIQDVLKTALLDEKA